MTAPKPKQPATPRAKQWKARFLAEYRRRCSVMAACIAVKIHKSTVYDARRDDAAFRAEFDEIANGQNELLEASAMSRATFGVEKPHYHLGVVCGTERVYPDALTQFLLERRLPQKYGRFGGEGEDLGEVAAKLLAFRDAARATQQGPDDVEALRAKLAALEAENAALKAEKPTP